MVRLPRIISTRWADASPSFSRWQYQWASTGSTMNPVCSSTVAVVGTGEPRGRSAAETTRSPSQIRSAAPHLNDGEAEVNKAAH